MINYVYEHQLPEEASYDVVRNNPDCDDDFVDNTGVRHIPKKKMQLLKR